MESPAMNGDVVLFHRDRDFEAIAKARSSLRQLWLDWP
jgi:hypothetical protein